MENTKYSGRIFRADSEYFTFISGAIISIPLSLLFEFRDNYLEWSYWVALVASMLASILCFNLAIKVKIIQESWKNNKKAVGHEADEINVWNKTIANEKGTCYLLTIFIVVLLVFSIVATCIMQFSDSSAVDPSQITESTVPPTNHTN